MTQDTRYTEMVNEIRVIATRMHDATVDLYLKLREVEREEVWRLGQHALFADFLRAEFPNAFGIEKYQNAIQAIEYYGEAMVRKVGVEAAHAMCVSAIVTDDQKRETLAATIDRHIADRGCAPDADTIRKWSKGIAGEQRRPPRIAKVIAVEEHLREENKELRQKIRELEREITHLRAKLEKKGKRSLPNANAST